MSYRIGWGHDLHRLAAGRPLRLGGVAIEHDRGPVAHSDGDVVLHAVCDALLGAAGLGDIGEWFPSQDPKWKDADSRQLLRTVLGQVYAHGLRVGNIDVLIQAEAPRLEPHKPRIRAALAELLGVSAAAVNIKAATNEGLDALGRGDAIACQAVALLWRPADSAWP